MGYAYNTMHYSPALVSGKKDSPKLHINTQMNQQTLFYNIKLHCALCYVVISVSILHASFYSILPE